MVIVALVDRWTVLAKERYERRMNNPKMATYGKRKDAGTVQLPDHTAKLVLRPSTKALARRRAHSRTTNPKMLKYGNNCGAGTVQLLDHTAK